MSFGSWYLYFLSQQKRRERDVAEARVEELEAELARQPRHAPRLMPGALSAADQRYYDERRAAREAALEERLWQNKYGPWARRAWMPDYPPEWGIIFVIGVALVVRGGVMLTLGILTLVGCLLWSIAPTRKLMVWGGLAYGVYYLLS